jgi:hypothetical protein
MSLWHYRDGCGPVRFWPASSWFSTGRTQPDLQRMKLLLAPYPSGPCRVWTEVCNPASIAVQRRELESTNLRQPAPTLTRRKGEITEATPAIGDQRPDWIEREGIACAEPKGGRCAERVTGVCAEREGGGCAGRAAARARLLASYRPTMHPVAAPNIVGQRPARCSPRDDMPRPT